MLLGPPVGGALFSHFGFRGPCIFGVIVTMVDLVGRLLIIERKDAIRYGFDPALVLENDAEPQTISPPIDEVRIPVASDGAQERIASSPLGVIAKLGRSPRALTAFFLTFIWGSASSAFVATFQFDLTVPQHCLRWTGACDNASSAGCLGSRLITSRSCVHSRCRSVTVL